MTTGRTRLTKPDEKAPVTRNCLFRLGCGRSKELKKEGKSDAHFMKFEDPEEQHGSDNSQGRQNQM